MSRSRKIMIFLCFAAFCWLAVAGWGFFNGRQGSSVDPIYNNVINATEMDASYTYIYDGETDALPDGISGAVTPSPAAYSEMTARTMASLSSAASSKLILVVTFADDLEHDVVTSWLDWQTPFGIVQVNGTAISHLQEQGAVADSDEMKKVSAITDLLPYFSYYFPDQRIAPLVFDSSLGAEEVTGYMDRLAQYKDGYFVLMITEEQKNEVPLFTADAATLIDVFDHAAYGIPAGALSAEDCAKLGAMKAILQYDGDRVLQVLQNYPDAAVPYDHISIIYGKEN